MGSSREDLACQIDSENANRRGHQKSSATNYNGILKGSPTTSVMALVKTVPATTPIKPPLLGRLTPHAHTDQPRQLTTEASFANAERGHRLRSLGSNTVISITSSPSWILIA
jgi:hypothetical protein